MGEVQSNGGIDDTNVRRYSKMEEKVNRLRSQIVTSNNNPNLKSKFTTLEKWDSLRSQNVTIEARCGNLTAVKLV